MEDERDQGPEQSGEHVRDGLGALLDEFDGDGDPPPEANEHEDDDAEDDPEDDREGQPRLGLENNSIDRDPP